MNSQKVNIYKWQRHRRKFCIFQYVKDQRTLLDGHSIIHFRSLPVGNLRSLFLSENVCLNIPIVNFNTDTKRKKLLLRNFRNRYFLRFVNLISKVQSLTMRISMIYNSDMDEIIGFLMVESLLNDQIIVVNWCWHFRSLFPWKNYIGVGVACWRWNVLTTIIYRWRQVTTFKKCQHYDVPNLILSDSLSDRLCRHFQHRV